MGHRFGWCRLKCHLARARRPLHAICLDRDARTVSSSSNSCAPTGLRCLPAERPSHEPACKCVPQVVPTKVLDPRFHHRRRQINAARFQAVRRSWPTGTHGLSRRPCGAQPSGRQPQHHLTGRVWVLRPQDVQHPTSKVYHVPSQAVLTALPQTGSNSARCKGQLAWMAFRNFFSSSTSAGGYM